MEKFEGILIWGTGLVASELNKNKKAIIDKLPIVGYIDNDEKKWGSIFCGKIVFAPNVLKDNKDYSVYIAIGDKEPVYNQICRDYPFYEKRILSEKNINILNRYYDSEDQEIQEVLNYLKRYTDTFFNYDFINNYDSSELEIKEENGLFYTFRNGRKLFFSRDLDTEDKVREYYNFLLIEQDRNSPHRYLEGSFDVKENSIVVDAGAAEGFFALDIIDKAKKIYIFEPDKKWCEALKETFKEYQEKVVIVEKFLSDYEDDVTTTIDKAVIEESIDFIKMDIEGSEFYALNGAKNKIKQSKKMQCAVCTYHQEFAYYALKDYLETLGFEVSHTKGYMLWDYELCNREQASTLRRGVIRAFK